MKCLVHSSSKKQQFSIFKKPGNCKYAWCLQIFDALFALSVWGVKYLKTFCKYADRIYEEQMYRSSGSIYKACNCAATMEVLACEAHSFDG